MALEARVKSQLLVAGPKEPGTEFADQDGSVLLLAIRSVEVACGQVECVATWPSSSIQPLSSVGPKFAPSV